MEVYAFRYLIERLPSLPVRIERDRNTARRQGFRVLGPNDEEPCIRSSEFGGKHLIALNLGSLLAFIRGKKEDEKLMTHEAARIHRTATAPWQIDIRNPEVEFGSEHPKLIEYRYAADDT